MYKRQEVRAGGKLYVAGEYSILTPGQTAIIQFIPIYMQAEIQPASTYRIQSDMFPFAVDLTPNTDYALIQETVHLMNAYLQSQGVAISPFDLRIGGKFEREGKKFGIGSSGSVVLLTLKAMACLLYTSIGLPKGSQALTLALGIIGATVMPHNLYLHSSISQTRKVDYEDPADVRRAVRFMTWDSNIELTLAFVVNSLLLILGAALFFGHAEEIGAFSSMYDALQNNAIAGAIASPFLSTLFAVALLASCLLYTSRCV